MSGFARPQPEESALRTHLDVDRPVDWRWRRANWLAQRCGTEKPSRRDDEHVRSARKFVVHRSSAGTEAQRDRLWRDNPWLWHAVELHEYGADCPELVLAIQARLLAGQSDEEIAKKQALQPPVVGLYARLFFDVRDRLEATDWIMRQAVAAPRGERERRALAAGGAAVDEPAPLRLYDRTVLMFSYFGGPEVANLFLAGLRRSPIRDRAQLTGWLDGAFGDLVRRQSVQALARQDLGTDTVADAVLAHVRLLDAASHETGGNDLSRELGNVLELLGSQWGLAKAARPPAGSVPGREPSARELMDAALGKPTVRPQAGTRDAAPA